MQQLHAELRRLKRDLDLSFEAREDLQEELKEMTQLYLTTKQERDKYKAYVETVRRDVEGIDKIVKENVERAMRGREKQINEMAAKIKEWQDKVSALEAHKECFANTIRSLEGQIEEL